MYDLQSPWKCGNTFSPMQCGSESLSLKHENQNHYPVMENKVSAQNLDEFHLPGK
jgi:hypothetical protein